MKKELEISTRSGGVANKVCYSVGLCVAYKLGPKIPVLPVAVRF